MLICKRARNAYFLSGPEIFSTALNNTETIKILITYKSAPFVTIKHRFLSFRLSFPLFLQTLGQRIVPWLLRSSYLLIPWHHFPKSP